MGLHVTDRLQRFGAFRLSRLLSLVACLLFAVPAAAAWAASDAGYVTTGQTGAQTQIDADATSSFTIVATASAFVLGGDFVMKSGSSTTASISFRLYEDPAKTKLLAQRTFVNAAAFCAAHGGNCQSFSSTRFTFSTPVPIAAGQAYYAELTSPASAIPQSDSYFIKGGDLCKIVTNTGAIVPGTTCSGGIKPPPATPSLSVNKSGPSSARAPGTINYSLTVINEGEGPSGGASLKDQLPEGTTLVKAAGLGWNCTASGSPQLLSCRYAPNIPAGLRSSTLFVTVDVDDSQSVVDNWAAVDPTGGTSPITPSAAACSAADVRTGECDRVLTRLDIAPPFLDISLSDPSPTPSAGGNTTYTVTVVNNGDGTTRQPVHAYNVLPAGTTFVSGGNGDWTCTSLGGSPEIIDCLYQNGSGDLRPNEDSSFPIQVNVAPGTPGGTEFVDTAYVGREGGTIASPPAICDSNDTIACAQNSFVLPYKWTITKSAPQPPLEVGQQSTYTLTVTTNGEDVDADVKDLLPEGMVLISAGQPDWDCGTPDTDNLFVCKKTISRGTTYTIPVVVEVPQSLANQTVTNFASVGLRDQTQTPGPACRNPSTCASNTETVLTTSGFSLTKSDPEPPLEAGKNSTYTLTLETDSPGAAVDVKDLLPPGLTLVEAKGVTSGWTCTPGTPAPAANPLTCSNGSVAAVETITVEVAVDANPPQEVVTNYASAGPQTTAPEPGPSCTGTAANTCASNEAPINPQAGHRITKSAPVPPLEPGRESVYTLTVSTDGTDVATEVKDLLPEGLTLVRAEGTDWFCQESSQNELLCQKTISKGTDEIIKVTVETARTAADETLTNYASTGPDGRAPEPGPQCQNRPDCAENTSTVQKPGAYTITKSAPVPPLRVGQESVYTLTINTTGDDVAAEVKDQLPEGMTLVSAEGEGWACDPPSNNLFACRKTVSSAKTEQIRVTVTVGADTAGQTLVNYASFGPEGQAPEPGPSCQDRDSCAESPGSQVQTPSGYSITKSQPSPPLEVNRQSTYIITVGTDAESADAEVKDQLPAGMTLVSAQGEGWACAVDTANLVLCKKTITGGQPEQIAVTVKVGPEINDQVVTNYASTGDAGSSPQPGPSCTLEDQCASSEAKVADIRDKIEQAVEEDVKAFLEARLDQIVGSFDQQSRLMRFRNTACGESHDLQLSGDATSNDANLAASGSFSFKGGGVVPTADVPEQQCGRFNIWAEVDANYVDGLQDSSAKGGMLTTGAEYLISDNFLAGVRLSIDYTEARFDSDANSDIDGYGWLAGPYISAEIATNVFLDGFLGYGTSWNDYEGNYEGLGLSGDFETQRIAGYLNLSGNYQTGAVLLTPLLGVAYGKEWSDAFKVHNGIVGNTSVDSQDAALGRITGRIEAGYLVTDLPGERLEVFLAPKVTYDMVRDGGDYADLLLGDGLWRGGLEGGFRFSRDRLGASLLLGYDGLGVSDWSAYRGQLQVNYSW